MSWELTGNTGTNPDINFVGTTDNEPLVIRTNSTKQLLIDTAGRVGLGTTNPLQNLHVSGNILVNSVTNLNDDNIAIKSSGPGFGVSVIGTLSVTNSAIGGIRQSPTANGGLFFLRESSGQIDKISLDADGNSYLNAGNVGIGTTAPGRLLTLEGGAEVALRLRDKSVSNGAFWELQPTAFQSDYFGIVRYEGGVAQGSKSLIIAPDGNIGIGTYTPPIPYPKLTVTGPDATVNVETTEILRVMRHGVLGVKNQNSAGFFVGAFESGINGRSQLDIKVAGWPGDSNTWGSAPDVTVMSLYGDGNVSIGTTNLGARLEIEGGGYGITSRGTDVGIYTQNITVPGNKVFLATTAVAGDFYGDVVFRNNVSVEGDVILTGADCAEEFDTAEAVEIEPGTVVVLNHDGVLHQSHQAYDKRVAGVVSGAGDYKPGLILDRRQSQDNRLPIALVGKVYCKVDAQYAPIEVGDLLTTSSTSGYAMKASDPLRAFGTVIGKALRSLEYGQGMIPILIALQ